MCGVERGLLRRARRVAAVLSRPCHALCGCLNDNGVPSVSVRLTASIRCRPCPSRTFP